MKSGQLNGQPAYIPELGLEVDLRYQGRVTERKEGKGQGASFHVDVPTPAILDTAKLPRGVEVVAAFSRAGYVDSQGRMVLERLA